ncbi:MAG: hypothetical protein FJ284_07000 [Planctomycetes bacterium]|nr:hypothetical protein [Planctomycetota bacterium]
MAKPVGLVTVETEAPRFLQGWCQRLGYRAPEDVQIIGIDDENECLACEPHLTSMAMPNKRIGRTAVETLLDRLRRDEPPAIVRVPGAAVIPRGLRNRFSEVIQRAWPRPGDADGRGRAGRSARRRPRRPACSRSRTGSTPPPRA